MNSYKIDLHTHSTSSPDGGISRGQYRQLLHDSSVNYIAVTDHNEIRFAQLLKQEFGERIIVGEEIMTTAGEIIGLYLETAIAPGQSAIETAKQIKAQGGLVYIPHPFETVRKGIRSDALDDLVEYVDIVEVYNGRAWLQQRSAQAVLWARLNAKISAASSDAHGIHGVGRTFTHISAAPTADTLVQLLSTATVHPGKPTLRSLLYPKYHRLRKKTRRSI